MKKHFIPLESYANRCYENANSAWEGLYVGLNFDPQFECAPRGLKIREIIGANITILNPMDNLIYNKFRKSSPYYIAQEYFWYLSGDNRAEEAAKMTKFWLKIANNDGTVNSNYGKYIFKDTDEENRTQWQNLIRILGEDPDSRKAIIQLPIRGTKFTKDTICTSSFQFLLREGKLYMITYMRSNDLMKGFCNDIPFFTTLQIMLAKELGVELGWYCHMVGSLHLYENDFIENAKEEFRYSDIKFDYYPESVQAYDFEHDYRLLKDRITTGVRNPILLYMAYNFDKKNK